MIASARDLVLGLLRWLVGGRANHAQDVDASVEQTWHVQPWIPLLTLLAAAAVVVLIYSRERGTRRRRVLLAVIRCSLIGLAVLMMYGFVIRPYRTDRPDMVVLLDDSASMSVVDQVESERSNNLTETNVDVMDSPRRSRWGQAQTLLLQNNAHLLNELDTRYKLKLRWLSGSSDVSDRPTVTDAVQQHEALHTDSPLGDRLGQIVSQQRGRPTAAVIVFSDGITTIGRSIVDAAQDARRKSMPLYLIGLGSEQPARDLALKDLLVDDVVFVNDIVDVRFTVAATGYANRTVTIRLRRADNDAVLSESRMTFDQPRQSVQSSLRFRADEEGEHEYVVEVQPQPDELNTDNNLRRQRVSVRDERIRVLLVHAYPSYEFQYLKNLLGRDYTDEGGKQENPIQLHSLLQDADVEYAATDQTALHVFPVRREELFEYDVLIFGDVNPSFFSRTALTYIVEFAATHGGGILFSAGPRFVPLALRDTPLASLLPVRMNTLTTPRTDTPLIDPIRLQPTRLGLASPHMQLSGRTEQENLQQWRELSPLYWMVEAADLKPGAQVLAEHPTRTGSNGLRLPLITLQFVGVGKVIFHATDETWRWRIRRGDELFARYWLQTVRFLGRGNLGQSADVQLTTDRAAYERGEPVRLRTRFADERLAPADESGVTVMLERPGHAKRQVTLHRTATRRGVFETDVTDLGKGDYHAWLVSPSVNGTAPSCDFAIANRDTEMTRLEMQSDLLKRAARLSEGRFYDFQTAAQLLNDLPEGRHVRVESLPTEPVWNSWKLALLFVVLIVTEWILRRRSGLL